MQTTVIVILVLTKVIIKLSQEGASFRDWNPIVVTKAINKLVGEVTSARVTRYGALLIVCRDTTQQGKAIRLSKTEGENVRAH